MMFVIRHYAHPSTTFRELEPTEVTLNKKFHLAFTAKKDIEISRVIDYTGSMTTLVLENMWVAFLNHIKNAAVRLPGFIIKTDILIQHLKGRFLEEVPAPVSAAAPSDEPWGEEEVALAKLTIEKVSGIISSYFQKSQHVFSVSDNTDSYETYCSATFVDLYEEVYDSFKVKKTQIPSSFSEETLREFEVPKGMRLRNPHKMPCYSFAYMNAKEKRATSIIFEESERNEPLTDILTQLKEWKYQSVDFPIAGDLVVYIKATVPTHVGVYQESGKVLSKLSIKSPTSREHEIFDVSINAYGRQVLFFRKPIEAT